MTPAVRTLRQFLLEGLDDGSLTRGSRLPSERELASSFALPRAAVRDALLALELEGYVERRAGSGTFVARTRVRAATRSLPDISPAQVMEARLAIEPQFAELVVLNATTADLEVIDRCNRHTAAASTAQEFRHWNGKLHHAIAAATRNEFLITVFGLVLEAQQHPTWGALMQQSVPLTLRREYQKEHDAIVNALKARDVALARQAMATHLRHARGEMLDQRNARI